MRIPDERIKFDTSSSKFPIYAYFWRFNGDGKISFSPFESFVERKYDANGDYRMWLRVMGHNMHYNHTNRVIKIEEAKVNFTLNNKDSHNIRVAKGGKYVLKPFLNKAYNERAVSVYENSRIVMFNGILTSEIDEKGDSYSFKLLRRFRTRSAGCCYPINSEGTK